MLATCRWLYFAIAMAATLLMATLGTVYIQRIAAEYLSWQIYATWGLYIVSTFINLYIGYYSIVLTGIGDVFRKNKANIVSKGVFLLLGIVGLVSGFGILSLGVAYFASGLSCVRCASITCCMCIILMICCRSIAIKRRILRGIS